MTAEERFAKRLCEPSEPWVLEMYEIYDLTSLKVATSGGSARLDILGLAHRGKEVAAGYARRMRSVEVPPGMENGEQVQPALRAASKAATRNMSEAVRSLRRLPENLTVQQSRQALDELELTMVETMLAMAVVPSAIGPEVEQAVGEVGACAEFARVGNA